VLERRTKLQAPMRAVFVALVDVAFEDPVEVSLVDDEQAISGTWTGAVRPQRSTTALGTIKDAWRLSWTQLRPEAVGTHQPADGLRL